MRQRHERKIEKYIRNQRLGLCSFHQIISRTKQGTAEISKAVRGIALDPLAGWYTRGIAALALAEVNEKKIVDDLLHLFFSQEEKKELWETALTLEALGSTAAIPALVHGLHDPNPHRRHAAARALGWIPCGGCSAAVPLVRVLLDQSQPQPVREEAAESLAYLQCAKVTRALISVLDESDVRIRFWVVFALGSNASRNSHPDPRIIAALEQMLNDNEVPPGNCWPVGKEALAGLRSVPKYRSILDVEVGAILSNSHASPDDKRWADTYRFP